MALVFDSILLSAPQLYASWLGLFFALRFGKLTLNSGLSSDISYINKGVFLINKAFGLYRILLKLLSLEQYKNLHPSLCHNVLPELWLFFRESVSNLYRCVFKL